MCFNPKIAEHWYGATNRNSPPNIMWQVTEKAQVHKIKLQMKSPSGCENNVPMEHKLVLCPRTSTSSIGHLTAQLIRIQEVKQSLKPKVLLFQCTGGKAYSTCTFVLDVKYTWIYNVCTSKNSSVYHLANINATKKHLVWSLPTVTTDFFCFHSCAWVNLINSGLLHLGIRAFLCFVFFCIVCPLAFSRRSDIVCRGVHKASLDTLPSPGAKVEAATCLPKSVFPSSPGMVLLGHTLQDYLQSDVTTFLPMNSTRCLFSWVRVSRQPSSPPCPHLSPTS